MTTSPRVASTCVSLVLATHAFAADPEIPTEGSAPETVKVASVESVAAGQDDRKLAFVIVKSEAGQCYAIAPPGGEGMVAGDQYAVVAANDMDDATRAAMLKGHAGCRIVEVVARVAK